MISSATEFARLRASDDPADQVRASHESASTEVWREVIASFPDLREWIPQNKTTPIEILAQLALDANPRVRAVVADVRRLPADIRTRLARDEDPMVRARIACNTKTELTLLWELSSDAEAFVREAAATQLSRRAQ